MHSTRSARRERATGSSRCKLDATVPRPRKPATERWGVRVPVVELAEWHEVAAAEGEDLAVIARRAIRAEIKRLKRKQAAEHAETA